MPSKAQSRQKARSKKHSRRKRRSESRFRTGKIGQPAVNGEKACYRICGHETEAAATGAI